MGDLGYEREEHDFYPTPPWATIAMMTAIRRSEYAGLLDLAVWEPACGQGHISEALKDGGVEVQASTDLIYRGYGQGGVDFLAQTRMPAHTNLIITNPPYGDLAEKFIRHALDLCKLRLGAVIMLLRHEYDCAVGRSDIFDKHPAFAGRVILTSRPRWIEGSKGSPRHNYSWYIWDWEKWPQKKPIILYGHKIKGL